MKKDILLALVCIGVNLTLVAQENLEQKNFESAHDTITDSAILYPESMRENLSDLLQAWQFDLSKADTECQRGQNVVFHDSVYVDRLYRMPTEIELSYNQVVRSYIDMYANRRREQVSYMLSLGDYYFPMFEAALDRHGLPLELKYLPVIESALNPVAVSRVGATGLWQFMLRTGKGYGLEVNSLVDERRDPYKSTEAAVQYLKDLYTIYGDWNLVIAAYNCGPGNVNKAIARSGGKQDYWDIYYHLPRETRGYVPAFIAANYIMSHHADHNICPVHLFDSVGTALDTIHVNEQIHFQQIAGVLDVEVDELRRLNPQFRKDIIPGNYKPYALVLPSVKMYAFIDHNDSIMNYDRNRYFTHRTHTLDGATVSGNSEDVIYRVRGGDNLSTIARRNGTTVARLRSWNGLRSDRLSIGQRIVVGKRAVETPPSNPSQQVQLAQVNTGASTPTVNTYYRVRKGDTLGEIARKNGVGVSQLQSWNGLRSSRIGIGDQLIVGQESLPVPEEEEAVSKEQKESQAAALESPEASTGEGNIISNYLKEQLEKGGDEVAAEEELETEVSETLIMDRKMDGNESLPEKN